MVYSSVYHGHMAIHWVYHGIVYFQTSSSLHLYHHISYIYIYHIYIYIPTFEPQVGQKISTSKMQRLTMVTGYNGTFDLCSAFSGWQKCLFGSKGDFFDFGYAWYFSTVCLYSRSGPCYMLILRGEGVTAADFNALNMQPFDHAKATSFTRRSGHRSQKSMNFSCTAMVYWLVVWNMFYFPQ